MSARTPGVAVLMYHAIAPADGARDADPRYTIPRARFAEHLRALAQLSAAIPSMRDVLSDGRSEGLRVAITFDDGHETHYTEAFPQLLEAGACADFFVNPGKVGSAGHASWSQLREMSDAGMSIQSHGYDHTYFTAMTPNALESDLRRSKAAIEDAIGRAVTLLAPPGGRMPARLENLAAALGYDRVASSEPGRWTDPGAIVVPRLAITDATGLDDLSAWARGDAASMRGATRRHAVLGLAKRSLGDARYERLRARLLALRAPAVARAQDRPA